MGNAIKLTGMVGSAKWDEATPENTTDFAISAVVVTKPDAKIRVALTDLLADRIIVRAIAFTALGNLIQVTDKIDSDGKIMFTDALPGMVYGDGFTVVMLILFNNGEATALRVVKA